MRDPEINAFAIPGGFVLINSGLILATRNENELAGVLAHETAHVTQRHIVRQLIDQSHEGLMATAAMLAAILLGATAGRGSPDAIEAAILAGQSAMIQHQINYTRSQRVRSRSNRHQHHGERGLRSVGHGQLLRLHGPAAARNRAASMRCSS